MGVVVGEYAASLPVLGFLGFLGFLGPPGGRRYALLITDGPEIREDSAGTWRCPASPSKDLGAFVASRTGEQRLNELAAFSSSSRHASSPVSYTHL